MSLFNKIHGTGAGSSGRDRNSINARQFLGKEPGKNYFTPDTFLAYMRSLRDVEVQHAEALFYNFKNNLRVVGSVVTRTDKAGRHYYYLNFTNINGTPGLKVILEGGMKQFISDYISGKVAIDFTLEEVIDEALNV